MTLVPLDDFSSLSISRILENADSDVLFIADPRRRIEFGNQALDRMARAVAENGAGLVYADSAGHSRIDYQLGSIRDNFDFGPVVAVSVPKARSIRHGGGYRWAGFYDLRLRLSERHPIVRIAEPLYSYVEADSRTSGEKQFDYVDPKNRACQIEMEEAATAHLRRIGAYLPPEFREAPSGAEEYSVEASVIIPVRNRERTIRDAVRSALSQTTAFDFNVIVVDNHSTDSTTEILRSIQDPRLVHLIPERNDLGIGGCWNAALNSPACGRYAAQLDSDDLYASPSSLSRLVEELKRGPYAMVVGSYMMVDFQLETIPPGLIDHREWTRENGRNNALRINGLGAPRAFLAAIAREIGFPNVSYGEDYAMALRISREYEIGRIYESLYLCRRWEGNTDSALPLETVNRHDSYKDGLRTDEIRARQSRGSSVETGDREQFRAGNPGAFESFPARNRSLSPVSTELPRQVDRLLESQAAAWPALARGLQGLRESRTRTERVFGRDFLVRHIPHRIKSTTAPVDAQSVAQRACFLCEENLDPEEEGVPFDSEFTVYCNPFPILERHLTIVHREHRPQRISGRFAAMLQLAESLPDSFIVYNGPECGASAPDHLHFQACSRDIFPIQRDLRESGGMMAPGYIPRAFVLRDSTLSRTADRLERWMAILGTEMNSKAAEPMVNIAAFCSAGEWTVVVFPRGKHRPRVYETKDLTVSPATIDLCGVFVVPVPGDFEKIRGADIERILKEVTLPADVFESASARIEGA